MNDIIFDFAEESIVKYPASEQWVFTKEELEHFAKLIIKECASICELNGQSYKHSFTPMKAQLAESTSKYCGKLIERHFGVNE